MNRYIKTVEYELLPEAKLIHIENTSHQKSFNERCQVELANNGTVVYLRSYNTIIMKIVDAECNFKTVTRRGRSVVAVSGVKGKVVERYWSADGYQQSTTLKHIAACCGLHKKEFMELPRKRLTVYIDMPKHDNNADE